MKKSFLSFVILFVAATFISSDLFAAVIPVPGADIIVKKKPGGIAITTVHTDKSGNAIVELAAGEYEITISWSEVEKAISSDKGKTAGEVTMQFDCDNAGIIVEGRRVPAEITINKETTRIVVTVPKDGAKSRRVIMTLRHQH